MLIYFLIDKQCNEDLNIYYDNIYELGLDHILKKTIFSVSYTKKISKFTTENNKFPE